MKNFFRLHSYDIVKLFLNQFAIAIFGIALAIATGKSGNKMLVFVTGILSIVFYLFLIYMTAWEIGSKDISAVKSGNRPFIPLTGTYVALCSNSLNFILAIIISLAFAFSDVAFFSTSGGIASTIALLIEGMYTGILSFDIGGAPLNSYWWIYYLIPLPSVIVSTIAYLAGYKGVNITGIFTPPVPESDREPKNKKK